MQKSLYIEKHVIDFISFNASWLQKGNVDWFSLRGYKIATSHNLNILLMVRDFFYPTIAVLK